MVRKFFAVVILAPLAIIIVLLAVANRAPVTISFDPFNPLAPAYTMRAPLFILILLLLLVGVMVGGIAAWLRQSKWRRAARRLQAEVRELRAELDGTGRGPGRERSGLPTHVDAPPLVVRPPAA